MTWLLAVPACLAAILVWRATAYGIGFSPDGRLYLDAARSFAATGGLWIHDPCGKPLWMNMVPPLVPAVAGAGIAAGFDAFEFVRVLNTACAGLSAGFLAWAVRSLSQSAVAGTLAGFALAFLPDFLDAHRRFLSEPLFFALLFGGCLLCVRSRFLGAAALFGLAGTARFAGAPFIAAGALFVWWTTRKIGRAAAFLAVGIAPMAIVAAINSHFAGGGSDREIAFNPISLEYVRQALAVVGGWARLEVLLAMGALILWKGRATMPILFAGAYLLFLLVTRLWLDAGVELIARYMVPIFGLMLLAWASVTPRWLLLSGLILLAAVHLRSPLQRPPELPALYNSNHHSWKQSETLRYAAALPGISCYYASRPDLVHLQLGKPAGWLPRRLRGYTSVEETDWCRKVDPRRPAAFVFLDLHAVENSQVSEPELAACLGLVDRVRLSDGAVVTVR